MTFLLLICCRHATVPIPEGGGSFPLSSPAFASGGRIPVRFTCDGENASPPLSWSGAPKSDPLVLLVNDRDAPSGLFLHWVVSLPPATNHLAEGRVPSGSVQGRNSFGHDRYEGPCPPPGDKPHRYVFRIYALRGHGAPNLSATPDDLLGALGRRVEGVGELRGTYGR